MVNYLLHLVTDDRIADLPELVMLAIENGVNIVQLRNKTVDKLTLYEVGKKIQAITKPKKIPFIINDHIDLAMALDADGVHLGQTDLPISFARKALGKNKIIGLSIQTIQQAEQDQNADVDYFGVGPIFPTAIKSNVDAMGLSALKTVSEILNKPCIAIGGIQIHNTRDVILHGAAGIAVISGICNATNPDEAIRKYIDEINHAKRV